MGRDFSWTLSSHRKPQTSQNEPCRFTVYLPYNVPLNKHYYKIAFQKLWFQNVPVLRSNKAITLGIMCSVASGQMLNDRDTKFIYMGLLKPGQQVIQSSPNPTFHAVSVNTLKSIQIRLVSMENGEKSRALDLPPGSATWISLQFKEIDKPCNHKGNSGESPHPISELMEKLPSIEVLPAIHQTLNTGQQKRSIEQAMEAKAAGRRAQLVLSSNKRSRSENDSDDAGPSTGNGRYYE